MSTADDRRVVEALIANDPEVIEDFFFNRCRAALSYIGHYFCDARESAESLIGEFYEYLSADDWHKLRIFRFSSSLNAYISVIATRYFQSKRDSRMTGYGSEPLPDVSAASEPCDTFTQRDVEALVANMKPLDRFLIEHILIDGDRPADVLDEAASLMDAGLLDSMSRQQFAAYIYTRYSRARRRLQNQLIALGYGA